MDKVKRSKNKAW